VTTPDNGFAEITHRELGLRRQLTSGQMSMIAIGGAIGTGLFMGSAYAIGYAGPSVLVSYAIGALITLLLMGCLAEMTVAHSTSGSFGAYAEFYISPLAGFLVRYAYWAAIVLAVGAEVTAVAMYMKYWFAHVPEWVWIVSFSSVLILLNAISVKTFGNFEYWFSTIKISAIVGFIILAVYVVFGSGNPQYGVQNYTAHDGFFPHGVSGMWIAVIVSIFSYLSVEMIAVAAGEAADPEQAVKKAFRATIVRLVVFYLLTLALMLAIVPWNQAGQAQSPFVTVMQTIGIPGATGVMNFVILIAALSAMNSQLYITTRMMFSLSRAGFAPRSMGALSKSGIPLNALLLSSSGIALATLLNLVYPGKFVHPDDGDLDVWRDLHLVHDLPHAPVLPALSQAPWRREAVVPVAPVSLQHVIGAGADGCGDDHHVLHRSVQDDPGVWRAVPADPVGGVLRGFPQGQGQGIEQGPGVTRQLFERTRA